MIAADNVIERVCISIRILQTNYSNFESIFPLNIPLLTFLKNLSFGFPKHVSHNLPDMRNGDKLNSKTERSKYT